MQEESSAEKPSKAILLLLTGLFLVALLLRLHGMLGWPARVDEGWTTSNAQMVLENGIFAPHVERMHPVYFWIVAALFKTIHTTSLLVARLPALLAGILAIPLFWWLGRRVVGDRAVLIALTLITFSEWHMFHSGQARFYSTVFLLGGIAAFLLYIAVWENRPRYALWASIIGLLGIGFHVTGASVIVGSVFYILLLGLFRKLRPQHSIKKIVLLYLLPLMITAPVALILALFISKVWTGYGVHWNYTPVHLVLGLIRSVGLTVMLAACGGVVLGLWLRRGHVLFLVCLAVPAMCMLIAVSPFVDTRPDYAFSVMPAIFMLAGVFCVLPFEQTKKSSFYVTILAGILIVSELPSAISIFTESANTRPNLPGEFVASRAMPTDRFVAYMPGIDKYLPQRSYRLAQTYYSGAEKWKDGLNKIEQARNRTWLVFLIQRAGMPYYIDNWLCQNARLVKRWRATRFDYLSRDVEVWLYDPAWNLPDVAAKERR